MSKHVEGFDALINNLGFVVFSWGNYEHTLGLLMDCMIEVDAFRTMPMFYSVTSNRSRAGLVKAAINSSSYSQEVVDASLKHVEKFSRLSTKRNTYIHGHYTFLAQEDIVTAVVSIVDHTKSDLRSDKKTYGTIRPLNGGEIKNHCTAVQKATAELHKFIHEKLKGISVTEKRIEFDVKSVDKSR